MLDSLKLEHLLLIDIETVPQYPDLAMVPEEERIFWDRKAGYLNKDAVEEGRFYERAGIYAEFGKVVCISLGKFIRQGNNAFHLKIKSLFHTDELSLLKEFTHILNALPRGIRLCAHNGKEFDFPYLCRRLLINEIPLPALLDMAGKKPWEVNFIDTLELWKFGDYKHYTSLDHLALLFKLDTPKDDISGADVARVYWKEKDLERIRIYCQKDVVTLARLLMKFKGMDSLQDDKIIYV